MKSFQANHLNFLLLILILFLFTACSRTFEQLYPDVYENYLKFPPQKALAVAVDYNGGYAYGFGSGAETIKKAKKIALHQCRIRRRKYKVEDDCNIYMVNNKKVNKEES